MIKKIIFLLLIAFFTTLLFSCDPEGIIRGAKGIPERFWGEWETENGEAIVSISKESLVFNEIEAYNVVSGDNEFPVIKLQGDDGDSFWFTSKITSEEGTGIITVTLRLVNEELELKIFEVEYADINEADQNYLLSKKTNY